MENSEAGLRPVSVVLVLMMLFILSCSDNHLINDSQYRLLTEKAFTKKKELAVDRDSALFSIFKTNLSIEQTEALKFLYAYMPLSDLADYDGRFFLDNVNISLRAKKESSWGKNIPEEVFLHYVLPPRINNENLESFRIAYFDELINRVKGKEISEAALEINHWCHEKVSYLPADIRTSGPESTILSARGRCGEESTFTVAALRTVGIPARQVYTPRWAHSDDNHAWVEIWINGGWNYMGACEPEPVLDRGWFSEPARRAMLVHTKSFGAFSGNENAINKTPDYTDVNNLSKYAITKKIFVKVIGENNAPVSNAKVEFQLYNYAEFYPLAVISTDEKGVSQFETGLGDLLIWAHKDDNFDFRKISVSDIDTLRLKLAHGLSGEKSIDLDLGVPEVLPPFKGPEQELIKQNSLRIKYENSIRQKYIDSWMKPAESKRLALTLNIDTAKARVIFERSMGNYNEISLFLSKTPDSLLKRAVSLLEILPDKDLRDTKNYILSDHLRNSHLNIDSNDKAGNPLFLEYILNPRIANELIVAWRHYFLSRLPSELKINAQEDPTLVISYLNDNIRIDNDDNYYKTPITPIGVNELKVADTDSRAISFVAICRSLGIPARLEPGMNIPQYFFDKRWNDVYFSDQKKPDQSKGYIKLESSVTRPIPEYYIHFTLARFENGRYNTLEYDYNKKITEFKDELPLPPGHYMLVTGNRLNDSKILSNISFFDLAANEHIKLDVKIRKDFLKKKILGKIDLQKLEAFSQNNQTSQSCINDKGIVIVWIDPEKEPTKHIFNDLPLLKAELEAWGGKFLFLSDSLPAGNSINSEIISRLPVNTTFGIDARLKVLRNCLDNGNNPNPSVQPEPNLPVFFVMDRDGNILFRSEGYRIGIGEQILKSVR